MRGKVQYATILDRLAADPSAAKANARVEMRHGVLPQSRIQEKHMMKTKAQKILLPAVLIAGLGLMPAGHVAAQTFTNLYNFTNGNDGANPYGIPYGVILSGSTLYGTATFGGSSGNGTVFALNTNGSGFTNLHSFARSDRATGANSDGVEPSGLILSGNTLYGTATFGGSSGNGTVFALNTNGTGFTNLHSFTATNPMTGVNTDGANPFAGLVVSGNTLYGTACNGGGSGTGTIFALNTNGTGFTNLHSFTATNPMTGANTDGASPFAGLIVSGNTLYGTTYNGGSSGAGTVFAVNTNGTGFTNLHSFAALSAASPNGTNTDGAEPFAGLIVSGGALFGAASYGGSSGNGTVFVLNTNGMGFTNLHVFTASSSSPPYGANSDGAYPIGLILSGKTLYGAANSGGSSGNGTLFAVNTNGAGFANLHNFAATNSSTGINSDGANPNAGLIFSGNTLYGTAYYGGTSADGTVFGLSLPSVSAPPLAITLAGANIILTWPANATGFNLQSVTNLVSRTAWNAVSPAPTVVNGQNAVTNPVSGPVMFYRLSQ
jgi:uncharacterized repeat protein (TIGR03803 family)